MFHSKPPNGKVTYVTTVMGGATGNAVQSLGISPQGGETAHADNLADLIIQSSTYPMVTHMLATQYTHAPAFTCALTHAHTFIPCALFACHACK